MKLKKIFYVWWSGVHVLFGIVAFIMVFGMFFLLYYFIYTSIIAGLDYKTLLSDSYFVIAAIVFVPFLGTLSARYLRFGDDIKRTSVECPECHHNFKID